MSELLDDEQTGGSPEPISIRDSLADAFDALGDGSGDGGATPADTGQVVAKPTADKPATQAKTAAPGERARDETGKFAKPADAGQTATQSKPTGLTPAGEAQQAPIVPPASWSATAKAKFSGLDPDVQREVLRREGEMDTGRAQWQQGAERLNRLDAVLRPRQEQFHLAGVDDVRAIETLFAAQDFLNRDPIEALIYLGRQSGVNWQALGARLQGHPARAAQAQPGLPQELAPLANQVQALTQWAQAQQQSAGQARMQGHLDQVQTFASDPNNLYFENVKGRMSHLIRSGAATDLADAYSQACWADPEVRPLMLQAQQREQQQAAAQAAKLKTRDARYSSGSVVGSPSPGASPGAGGPKHQSVRGALADAWDAS